MPASTHSVHHLVGFAARQATDGHGVIHDGR